MKALRAYEKNNPDRLVYEDAPVPELIPGDVLIRVHASAVSPAELTWPTTWLEADGSDRQLPITPGHEVSGEIIGVSPFMTRFAIGDEVFGLIDFQRNGSHAQCVAAQASELARKPVAVDHVHAAAVPLSALTAWQGLFDQGHLTAGQTVLIQGAAGGVGTFAVQFARWKGARVIATASSTHESRLKELGASDVIDYHTQAFTDAVHDVDLVFDTVGGKTWEQSWQVLRDGGTQVSVAVPRPPQESPVAGRHAVWFVVASRPDQLDAISNLIDAGEIEPVVSRVLPLAEGRLAFGKRTGDIGKTVLRIPE